jgi:ubiquinone/menaquinone biosynthesis C-methylase UbiE
MSMTHASKAYFERVADQWEPLRSGFFKEEVRVSAISKAYLRPEMVVADVGGGSGFLSAGLAPLVSRVHLLDGSPAMQEAARKNLQAFDNISYHLSESERLDLPDGSMDAVLANMYLHHCPDPLAAIREMVRVLKPGGRLVITDMDAHTHAWLKEEMADEWMGFERDQMRAWFKEADLVNTVVDCSGQNCCAESQEKSAKISVFVASATRRLQMRESVKDAYGAIAESGQASCGDTNLENFQVSALLEPVSCCAGAGGPFACCGPNLDLGGKEPVTKNDYSPQEMQSLPQEAGQISLGCGNPTAFAGLKPGETVLDIGSGGGIDAFLAAQKVGLDGKVIGVDMTPAMLARANATAQRDGFTQVEFRHGFAEALPVDDESVDVVISNCVINLCEDKGLVFAEIFRTLKPGGRLEVSDIVTDQAFSLEERSNLAGWAECITSALPEQEYLDLIAQAGFTDIRVRRSTSFQDRSSVQVFSAYVSAIKPGLEKPAGLADSCCCR